jgi:tetratricopeptide (TPR) repeat protein
MRNDEPFKAIHHLERATSLDPEYPDAFVELGRYYGLMGEPSLARATFERWTRAHPEDADMFINAGLTAFDAADYEMAMEFFDRALETAQDGEQKNGARTFRANSLDMLGRYPEAIAEYERVITSAPDWWGPTPTWASATRATAVPRRPRGPSGGALRSAPPRRR